MPSNTPLTLSLPFEPVSNLSFPGDAFSNRRCSFHLLHARLTNINIAGSVPTARFLVGFVLAPVIALHRPPANLDDYYSIRLCATFNFCSLLTFIVQVPDAYKTVGVTVALNSHNRSSN